MKRIRIVRWTWIDGYILCLNGSWKDEKYHNISGRGIDEQISVSGYWIDVQIIYATMAE